MPEEDPGSDSAAFAAHVLHAALGAPGADTPLAGATVLSLLGLLLAEGEVGRAAWILDTEPGAAATFEVRSYSYGGLEPEQRVTGLNAEGALRRVFGEAEAGVDLVEAVALDASGLTRRVIESRRGGQARYLVPSEGNYEGDPDDVRRALQRWMHKPSDPLDETSLSGPMARRGGAEPARVGGGFDPPPEVVDLLRRTVRQALEEVTVEVDLGAIEAVVSTAMGQLVRESGQVAAPAVDPDQLARLLAVLEHPPIPPAIDPAVATRLLDALERVARNPGPALPPLALERPAAAPVSDAAADRLRSRGPVGGPSDAAEVHLAAAAERLRAMSEMFEDRIRASTRALEVLADEVAADMRGSEDYLGQLSHSMTTVVERLGRRLESRLDGWSPAAAGTGSDLAILTQRLEAIVAALDEGALRP